MNTVHLKNNTYKSGLYENDHSKQMAKEKAKSIIPSQKQVQYRDALYKFCLQKGVARDGFRIGRTKQAFGSDIRAFITILKKHGLEDEFFEMNKTEE